MNEGKRFKFSDLYKKEFKTSCRRKKRGHIIRETEHEYVVRLDHNSSPTYIKKEYVEIIELDWKEELKRKWNK